MKIDAHQHFWRLADRAGHWPPPELTPLRQDFLPEDLAPLLRDSGVGGTVLVQSLPSEQDTEFMLGLARENAFVLGVVGWVDMKAANAGARIDRLAAHAKLKGLRPMLQDLPDDHWIDDPALDPAVDAMCRHGLVFDALVLPRQLPALTRFASRHPSLPMVIDHAAKPAIARGEIDAWRESMKGLAALPQMHCKLSGLLTEAAPGADAETLLPYVQTLWQLFGPARLIWGSDWPVLRLASDYAAWLALCEALLERMQPAPSPAQREAVFGGNAARLYRLG
jgi:L-fuconolactonase